MLTVVHRAKAQRLRAKSTGVWCVKSGMVTLRTWGVRDTGGYASSVDQSLTCALMNFDPAA